MKAHSILYLKSSTASTIYVEYRLATIREGKVGRKEDEETGEVDKRLTKLGLKYVSPLLPEATLMVMVLEPETRMPEGTAKS